MSLHKRVYTSGNVFLRSKIDQFLGWYENHQEESRKNKAIAPRVFVTLEAFLMLCGLGFIAIVAQTNAMWAEVDETLLKVTVIISYFVITLIGIWTHWWPLSAVCAASVFLIATLAIGYSLRAGEYDAGVQVIGAILFYLLLLFLIGIIEPRNWTKESVMYVLPFFAVVLYQILPAEVPEIPIKITKLESSDWIIVGFANTAISRGILKLMKRWILNWDTLFDVQNFIAGQYIELPLRKIYPARVTFSDRRKTKCPQCGAEL